MITTRHRYTRVVSLLTGLAALLLISNSQAALVFTGQALDVTFTEPGFSDLSDTVIAGPGIELIADVSSTSEIESIAMIDFESIDIGETSILFTLRGDGDDFGIVDSVLYQDTGTSSGATYIIGFNSAPFSIDTVSVGETTNLINLLPTDIAVIGGAVHFNISNLAIGTIDNGADLGTIRLNVGLIPIPAALPLMLSGLACLFAISRRRKHLQ